MHEQIYSFISQYFHREQVQTVDEHCRLLSEQHPNLFTGLCYIMDVPRDKARDFMLRFQWHKVEGPRRTSKVTKSKVVLEAAAYFYARIYPVLHMVYANRMAEEVMVVCPFAKTLECWERVIEEHLSSENAVRAENCGRLLTRHHHPRILSNSDDKDIRSSVVVIDPANQDGTKFGQGFFKQEMVETAVSRAKDVVIFIGNSCRPPAELYCTPREVWWDEEKSALTAAHSCARFNQGLLKCEEYKLREPLVSLGDIPQALLLDEEREAYAKLKESGDVDEVKW